MALPVLLPPLPQLVMSTGHAVDPSLTKTPRTSPEPLPLFTRLRRGVQQVAKVVRRIIGVPDYDTYLDHMRRQYPECTPLDATAFEKERMADRYTRPGSRCC